MDIQVKSERQSPPPNDEHYPGSATPRSDSTPRSDAKSKSRRNDGVADASKRRCVSTACIACRKRKSKCDGNLPACAACSSVYGTECVYDPNSDHRRKGVYKKDIDSLKTRNSTLQTLVHAILNYPEDQVPDLVRRIRACESLDKVAEHILAKEKGEIDADEDVDDDMFPPTDERSDSPTFESQLSSKIGSLRLDDGGVRYFGGTSNLLFSGSEETATSHEEYEQHDSPITSWTTVTSDPDLVNHLLNHYFTWHYTFFTILPKSLFYKHFLKGKPSGRSRKGDDYCTPLLVNTMLALGCHFTSNPGAREDPDDSSTAGDHFFKEAKRLLFEEDELSRPSLATVQALALMSVREAGCAKESNGWGYSGMAFRMSCDLGLSYQSSSGVLLGRVHNPDDEEEDARRVTFWGCFLVDKCWSNYLGRLPLFQLSANVTVPPFDVFPQDEADLWSPYSDSGFSQAHAQPSRTRAVALQLSFLGDISGDLIKHFYVPPSADKSIGKQAELKQLSEIHGRLEDWRRNLPKELEPKEGMLSSVIIMHMFFQLLYIHLFRPFLKYNQSTSPLPAHVSPRKICTQAAGMISKLLRLYKRSHGLRQIVNFAVYIAHSACIIHLLNLPEKTAKRDIIHGVKHLEEIAEGWLAARRTLSVLSLQARKWKVDLPEEAVVVLTRTDAKFGALGLSPGKTPNGVRGQSPPVGHPMPQMPMRHQPDWHQQSNFGMSETVMLDEDDLLPPQQHQRQQQQQSGAMAPPQNLYVPATSSTSGYTQTSMQAPSSQFMQPSLNLDYQMSSAHQHVPTPQHKRQHPSSTTNASDTVMQQPASVLIPPRTIKQPRSIAPSTSSANPFGGVEALLRENHDWWMRDQSADLASGFGNWRTSTMTGPSASTQTQTFEPTGNSGGQSWAQQQRVVKPSHRSTQGGSEEARKSSIGGLGSGGSTSYLDGYVNGDGTGPVSASSPTGFSGGGMGYGFGHLATQYDEDEWYQ